MIGMNTEYTYTYIICVCVRIHIYIYICYGIINVGYRLVWGYRIVSTDSKIIL